MGADEGLKNARVSRHAVDRFIERVFPNLSVPEAFDMLMSLAHDAAPLEQPTPLGDEQWRTRVEECVLVVRRELWTPEPTITTVLSTDMPSIDAQTRIQLRYGLLKRAQEGGARTPDDIAFVVDRVLDARLNNVAAIAAKIRSHERGQQERQHAHELRVAREARLQAEADARAARSEFVVVSARNDTKTVSKRSHAIYTWTCHLLSKLRVLASTPEVRAALLAAESAAPGAMKDVLPKEMTAAIQEPA